MGLEAGRPARCGQEVGLGSSHQAAGGEAESQSTFLTQRQASRKQAGVSGCVCMCTWLRTGGLHPSLFPLIAGWDPFQERGEASAQLLQRGFWSFVYMKNLGLRCPLSLPDQMPDQRALLRGHFCYAKHPTGF